MGRRGNRASTGVRRGCKSPDASAYFMQRARLCCVLEMQMVVHVNGLDVRCVRCNRKDDTGISFFSGQLSFYSETEPPH